MNDDTTGNELKICKFVKGYHIKEPTSLMLGVSMGSEKQTGKELESFVNMINSNFKNITKLNILVGAYLHRHYVGDDEAIRMHKEWVETNKNTLSKLKIPYEIIDWKDAINSEQYRSDLEFVKKLYETDSGFKNKVDNIARGHKHKADHSTAINYLLEECAYFKSLKGNFTYPALRLNDACQHIVSKYNAEFSYKPYTLIEQKKESMPTENIQISSHSNSSYSPPHPRRNSPPSIYEYESITPQEFMVCCGHFSLLMQKVGLYTTPDKEKFFSQFLRKSDEMIGALLQTQGDTYEQDEQQPRYIPQFATGKKH